MNKILKYILLTTGSLVAFLLILVVLAGLLIQTKPVKNKLAVLAGQKASKYLNGNLSIGEIEGNFFTHLKINHISLTQKEDTLISVGTFDASYNLWQLLSGTLQIHTALIDRPRLHLKQINDSTWNIQQIIKPLPEKSDQDSAGQFTIDISSLRLVEGVVCIDSPDTLIPRSIDHLNTRLSLRWSNDKQQIRLNSFSLSTTQPDLHLKQLSFMFRRDTSRMEITDLKIQTQKNKLEGTAAYSGKKGDKSEANLESDPIKTQEFEFFLPGLTLPATPQLRLDAFVRNDSLRALLDLSDPGQDIHLELISPDFYNLLHNRTDAVVRYQIRADLKHVDVAHWLGKPDLKYLINGHLLIKGKGIDRGTAIIGLDGQFTESRIADYPIDRLELNFSLDEGDLSGFAEGHGNFGAFRIRPQIRDLNGRPSYHFDLVTKRLNLAKITSIDSLQSDINLRAKVSGKGFDPKSMFAKAAINITHSRLAQARVDTMFANIQYGSGNFRLDSVWLKTGNLVLGASGNYSLQANSDLRLIARFDSIHEFAAFLPVDSLKTAGIVRGQLAGKKDSLNILASVFLNETRYKDFSFTGLTLDAKALLTNEDTLVQADLFVKNPGNKSFMLDSLSAGIEGTPDSIFLDLRINSNDMMSRLKTGIRLKEKLELILTDWLINYKNEHWKLQQAPATIEIDSLDYRIRDFRMGSGNSDTSQYIMANGIISRRSEENFQLKIANINLSRLTKLFQENTEASGFLNMNMDLKGTAFSPELKGDFNLRNAIFNQYPLQKMEGKFSYRHNQMNMETEIIPRDSGKVDFSANIPVQARLDSMDFNFNPKDPIEARLLVQRFPLAILNAFVTASEIKGHMNGKVTIDGTIDSPNPKGHLELTKGSFKMDKYGIDYRTINFNVQFLPEKISLDAFMIRTDDGTMNATGQIDFNSAFYKGDVSQSKINVKFNKFNPFDHDQFNMQLSGNAGLSGEKGKVVFDGNLSVPQSEFFLPTVLSMFGKMNNYEIPEPILVKEMKKISERHDTITLVQSREADEDSTEKDYLEDFTGKIKLKIPRNTWVKSDDMHIELSGDLELLKNKEFFEVFGTVDVVRGQYDLFGKTFVIDKGIIRFQGGEEITPNLDITASYGFRNTDRIEQNLNVHVTGTAKSPAVSFSMGGDSINEGDAFSYILFGKGMSELTADQQANMAGSGGGTIAGNAAASLISSQISNFLGDKLDMDYLEIKSEGGFENATVVVGKYITNDLFVSYEQRFGEKNEKDDLATYEVKLEYELFKFLFLQLNNSSIDSGFDVIFKLNSK
ncbi:MAG: translocation/assembly module TamB domain-containing protein [Mangrovibacterium sp.]